MNWLTILMIILMTAGILFSLYGIKKSSQLSMTFGMIAFLTPILYFIGWTVLLPFAPPAALAISFLVKRKSAVA